MNEALLKKFAVQENVLLSSYTTLGVGGNARYFAIAEELNCFIELIKSCYAQKLAFRVIGHGSNILIGDSGYPGLVIVNRCQELAVQTSPTENIVIAESGCSNLRLANYCVQHNLGGIEFLATIPGTIGGAVYGNAGCFEAEIGNLVKFCAALVEKDNALEIVKLSPGEMEFDYRSSVFKKNPSKIQVILSVAIKLSSNSSQEILSRIKKLQTIKYQRQPYGIKTCGSVFKNPLGRSSAINPDLNQAEKTAGYLLDQAQAKKLAVGGARVSAKHANFIVNHKNASADQLIELIKQMKQAVKEKFSIELKEEIEYIK